MELFHPISLIIPLLILVPNLIFFCTKPNHSPKEGATKEKPILLLSEGIGRIWVFILPVFASLHFKSLVERIAFFGMLLSLLLYYIGWLRYFIRNREFKLLFAPIIGIPVPMAISPIGYFLFAAVVLQAPYLFIGSIILAVGHIPISLNTYYRTIGA